MKIKLLNDGGYGDMENVKFPVEVEAEPWGNDGFDVDGAELLRVGATEAEWCAAEVYYFSASTGECEVLE